MATLVNDRDVLLQAATRDVDPRANKYLALSVTTPIFHVASNGIPTPSSITVTANAVNIGGGTVTFSTSAGTLTGTGNSRSLAFTDMPVDSVTITASITDLGQTYTATQVISKVADGAQGAPGTGTSPPMYATAILYKWSTVNPGLPNGTSTVSWNVGVNTSYIGSDGWYTTVQANPGTSGIQLWIAQKPVSAAAGTTTTDVTYSAGATLAAISMNGSQGGSGPQGVPGVPGIKNAVARAYQWSTGAAPTATGTATFTWASNDYNNVPSTGWSKTKPNAPGLGYTLYEASVGLLDSTGATTSNIDWTTAAIVGIGYIATNGAQGATGNSVIIGYSLVDGNSLNATPATTVTTGTAFPSTGMWGETRAWQISPPVPSAGQSVFQTNGIFNAGSNQTTWGVPYLSSLRVGSLSAISANLGAITAGSIDIGGGVATINTSGQAAFKSITIKDASGNVILSSGTALNPAYAAAGTLNSAITITSTGVLSGGGGGQVKVLPTLDEGQRETNQAPNWYLVGTTKEFKHASAVGLNDADGYWVTLETIIQYQSSGGGFPGYQYAYQQDKTWRRRATTDAGTAWTAWTQDLDRNVYTGDLNATNGATFGSNISGQITTANVATYIAPSAIGNTQIGGDLQSTNWNGTTGTSGVGWLMQRSGVLYANSVQLRGAVMGGQYADYSWPAAGTGGGFYLGPSGLLLGSANDGRYVQIEAATGNFYAPQFSIVNGVATLNGVYTGVVNANQINATSLSAMCATIGTLRTAASGGRTEISDNIIKVFDASGVVRVKLGNLAL